MVPDALLVLQRQVAERAAGVAAQFPAWPCRQGCDACCRRLAAPPRLTAAEWEWLRAGIAGLGAETRADVEARIAEMAASGPLTCPLLDLGSGSCRVYEHRPMACRAYGFYRERDRGLYCDELHARVEQGEFADTIWGNAATVEHGLRDCGEERDLRAWWAPG